MSFFQLFLFPNLRQKMRSSIVSNWYYLLLGLSKIFDLKLENLKVLRDSIWLESSTEDRLNAWGKRYFVNRLENESDESYRNRIIFKRQITKSGVSRAQKAIILETLLALPANSIRIENARDISVFRIGDPIGTGISSKKYFTFSYTIFINRELSDSQKLILKEYIGLVNIGGNFPLFAELKPPFPITKMGGQIGDVVISKLYANNQIYSYF